MAWDLTNPISSPKSKPQKMESPNSLAIYNNSLYVCDDDDKQVLKFSSNVQNGDARSFFHYQLLYTENSIRIPSLISQRVVHLDRKPILKVWVI